MWHEVPKRRRHTLTHLPSLIHVQIWKMQIIHLCAQALMYLANKAVAAGWSVHWPLTLALKEI